MGFIFRVERKVGKVLIHILKHIKCINTYGNVRIYEIQTETMYYISLYYVLVFIFCSSKRA